MYKHIININIKFNLNVLQHHAADCTVHCAEGDKRSVCVVTASQPGGGIAVTKFLLQTPVVNIL
jgi:hypothetical protein